MIAWRRGTVTRLMRTWSGVAEVEVELAEEAELPGENGTIRALAYTELVGEPQPGDAAVLNTSALLKQLGTGGYALIVALPDRLPADPSGPGHLVKARYTPLQTLVMGVDEQDTPHHDVIRDAESLEEVPVVIADLHSALPAILAGIRARSEHARVAYVMTDGGALPIWFSRLVSELENHLVGTVTVGQAFGGTHEAVTLHTGLLAARHVLHADIVIVTQGPGNLGTGTPWGFSGVAAGEAVNAVSVLGGTPVASLRVSDADQRERHTGVSHHSVTAYGKVALAPATIPIPDALPEPLASAVQKDVEPLRERHSVVEVNSDGLGEALRASPVKLSTMGRRLDDDYAYFLTEAAAGAWAGDRDHCVGRRAVPE